MPVRHGKAAVVTIVTWRPGRRKLEAGVHGGTGPREKSGDSASAGAI